MFVPILCRFLKPRAPGYATPTSFALRALAPSFNGNRGRLPRNVPDETGKFTRDGGHDLDRLLSGCGKPSVFGA